jgi:hypothetical protein
LIRRWSFGSIIALWTACIAAVITLSLGFDRLADANLLSPLASVASLLTVLALAFFPIVTSARWLSKYPHRHWHWAKLGLIWIVALAITAAIYHAFGPSDWISALVLALPFLGIASALTWTWLSAKENPQVPSPAGISSQEHKPARASQRSTLLGVALALTWLGFLILLVIGPGSPFRTHRLVESELRRFFTIQHARAQAGQALLVSDYQRSTPQTSTATPAIDFSDLYVDYDARPASAFPVNCQPSMCDFTASHGILLGATDRPKSWSAFAEDRSRRWRCGVIVMKTDTSAPTNPELQCSVPQ